MFDKIKVGYVFMCVKPAYKELPQYRTEAVVLSFDDERISCKVMGSIGWFSRLNGVSLYGRANGWLEERK